RAALAAPLHAHEPCEGFATDPLERTLYPCENVALPGRLPLLEMGVSLHRSLPYRSDDGSRWTDPLTERRSALGGHQSGTFFVDVTDPEDLRPLGGLLSETNPSTWRDVKVYADHALVVADGAGGHGMQVFDLTHLRGLDPDPQRRFTADVVYTGDAVN